jgi:hypothetical protein
MGRGLAGSLIVEQREPIAVDRDVVWVSATHDRMPVILHPDDYDR